MKDNNMVRGGQLLAKSFKEKGIEHVFTLAGGFCNPALEGFMNHQIPVINCPHEQIAGHLADGHTRLSRKPSVCLGWSRGVCECYTCHDGGLGGTISCNFCYRLIHS